MAKITTITNPLTGQPAQVDQLDHTAQQIDDGLNIARGVSNPNLLDNWYFRNPINQRQGRIVKPNTTYYSDNQLTTSAGTTGAYVTAYRYATGTANGVNYASFKLEDSDTAPTYYAAPENVVRGYTGAGYGIDRWLSHEASNTTLIYDDHITISRQHAQIIDNYANLVGKQVTISALTNLGLFVATGVCTNNDGGQAIYDDGNGHYIILYNSGTSHGFQINNTKGGTLDLYGVKLELGSQQTLAHQDADGNWVLNEIPDYGEQLARCQGHQLIFDKGYVPVGFGQAVSDSSVEIYIPTPVTLRQIPVASGNLFLRNGGTFITSSNIAVEAMSPNFVRLVVTATVTAGAAYEAFTYADNQFILDANL